MNETQSSLSRPYVLATIATIVLSGLASVVGLFVPGFYRDSPLLLPQIYGQDLLTLAVAVPALSVALVYAREASLRAYIVWLGVTGYLLYTYASYALMTAFNELYLVYTTLFGLTLYTFVGGMTRLDTLQLERAVEEIRVWPYVLYQALLAVLIGLLWLSEVLSSTLTGTTLPSIVGTGLPVNVIYSLDLGIVLPAFALSAYWLSKGNAWGYAFTAVLLVKGTTLGAAVLSMTYFMTREGQVVPLPQIAIFLSITLFGLVLTVRFLKTADVERGTPSKEQPTAS